MKARNLHNMICLNISNQGKKKHEAKKIDFDNINYKIFEKIYTKDHI